MSEIKVVYPQDQESNEYRYFDPEWLNEMAIGLTRGAAKHPGETWRTIPAREHVWRAVRHLVLWAGGDSQGDWQGKQDITDEEIPF